MVAREDLRRELIARSETDLAVRERLASAGTLGEDYHPEMEMVHLANAIALAEIIDRYGWPDEAMVGPDGAEAAWLILQHAISVPELQRRGLTLLQRAADAGRVPKIEVAMLEDRIAVLEGRPQRYGTQFDWDDGGELNPEPIEDLARVDEWRASIGLPPLQEAIAWQRAEVARTGERPPSDRVAKANRRATWLRKVGWRG